MTELQDQQPSEVPSPATAAMTPSAASDEDAPEVRDYPTAEDTEDAQSVIRFSIGHEQTRLTSSKTPAAEKVAAMEELEGGGLFPGPWQDATDTVDASSSSIEPGLGISPATDSPARSGSRLSQYQDALAASAPYKSSAESSKRLPSPWRSAPRMFQRGDEVKSTLRQSLSEHRRRASSSASATEALKKLIPFNMPKSPNILNFSFSGQSTPTQSQDARYSSNKEFNRRSIAVTPNTGHSRDVSQNRSRAGGLRHSTSDDSLFLRHALSRASSLGDDSRFEHVQEQVNSRLKAIKDSFQDSNFKLPSMPNLSSLSFILNRQESMETSSIFSSSSGYSTGRVRGRSMGDVAGISKSIATAPKTVTEYIKPPSNAGMTSKSAASHPFFIKALKDLTGDIVVLGGYRGSILRAAEPPHRQLWVPIKVGLNLRKVDLEVGLTAEDEERMEEKIIPGGMLTKIGPVDIAGRLLKRLKASENAKNGTLRVHEYGYDWRLSPHLLSRKLIEFLEKLPCNAPDTPPEKRGATVIAHSLGGLITRHAINQRPELFSGVIYAGVPKTCVNILGPFRNGDDVLLSSRVLTAQVNFTIRTSFALLPLNGKCFFDKKTKEEYPVDFFDPKTWIDYRLSPCVATPLPALGNSPSTSFGGIINSVSSSMSSVLPMLQGRRSSFSKSAPSGSGPSTSSDSNIREVTAAKPTSPETAFADSAGMAPQMNSHSHPVEHNQSQNTSVSTAVTIPRHTAIEYLTRTLAEVKQFKQALAFDPSIAAKNQYPPIAVIYGKSTPTVYGAKVDGRDGIKRVDAYDELAFASGDGVVLARAAMVPEGYKVMRGGVVSSDRGHVTLLGDLEAVGRCLNAIIAGKQAGIGTGVALE